MCPDLRSIAYVGTAPLMRWHTTDRHVDLRMLLTGWDRRAPGKKSEWAAAFGLPAQPYSGADVGRLYREGNIGAIADHCVADLSETWTMYARMAPLYLGRAA